MRALLVAGVVLGACGQDQKDRVPAPDIPPRARTLTDEQYGNAVHDLLGIEPPAIHTPGSSPHQLVHEDLVAVDGARLVEYRMAAEQIARQIANAPSCAELACALDLAERAFRRPLDDDERQRLRALFELGGFSLIVETVLQAPSFLYRPELDGVLGPYELATELSFLFYDSLPDDQLRKAARDGTLTDPDVLSAHVDRLLDQTRVQDHLEQVILDWFEIHRVLSVPKNGEIYPDLTPEMRQSMFDETRAFVRDVMWQHDGNLHELLFKRSHFADPRLAPLYADSPRAGLLTQASVLTMLAGDTRESIIQRGIYIHRTLLCTPELGRPPAQSIADLAAFTSKLSESQFAHYRAANLYCSQCHRIIDPPGRALEGYDAIGRWRKTDELGIAVEDDTTVELDGKRIDLRGGIELSRALANSPQVRRCAVQRIAEHAFGRELDAANIRYLLGHFEASDGSLVELFRALTTSPAFHRRVKDAP